MIHIGWALPGLALLLLIWGTTTHFTGGMVGLFTPENALRSLQEMLAQGELVHNTAISLPKMTVGLGLALTVGIPCGLPMGCSAASERLAMPALQFLHMISSLSWMPVVVMLLGIGDRPIQFLLSFAAVWPVLPNTVSGVRQLPPGWLLLARSLSTAYRETLWHTILSGVRAHILTGVRLAIDILWIVLMPCEMLGASSGLGYVILDACDRLGCSALMVVTVTIDAIGFLMDWLVRHFTHTVSA